MHMGKACVPIQPKVYLDTDLFRANHGLQVYRCTPHQDKAKASQLVVVISLLAQVSLW